MTKFTASDRLEAYRAAMVSFALMTLAPLIVTAAEAAAPAPNQARQAIENRKAVFTLIGNNFRPVGEILKGTATYESVDVGKLTARVAFLTGLLPEAFPDISQTGDTQAKPEIWSSRADFDRRLSEFAQHAAALSQLAGQHSGNSDAFKAAARAVVQDCKGCHDSYRNK
jgi:cytochrome c556